MDSKEARTTRTDPMAVIAFVLTVFGLALVGVILAIISLYRINADPELTGKGWAWAAIILTVVSVLIVVFVLLLVTSVGTSV